MADQVNFFIDSTDDPLLPDQIPAFDGGQFSNVRANLLQPNQSKILINCDIDKLGKIRTRRGTIVIANPAATFQTPGNVANKPIQGLTSYQTKDYNYIVAAHNGKLWAWTGTAWVQIALGGTADHEDILIARTGKINRPAAAGPPVIPAGYTMGATALEVDTLSGGATAPAFAPGEKLYFTTNLRTNYYEYTIKLWDLGTNTITLEEPGLVFDVKDNWNFTVLRPAKVTHPTPGNRYAAGLSSIAISGYAGAPAVTEKFVIKSENITHTLTAGSTNVLLNFTPALQADWAAGSTIVPIMFAQGNDSLFFTDGTGAIYAWTGGVPTSSTVGGGTLMKIGSHSILDDFEGDFHSSSTAPPQNVKIIVWFQNRLIASGIAAEPDAIYFSDYFDPSSWDRNYQKVRIGGGESDPITGLLAWTDYNLLVFKKNSIYVINLDPSQNPTPDDPTLLVASFSVKQLHKLIGCPAPLTAQQVGGGSTTPGSDIFFVDGDKKVHSIRRVLAAETQQEVGQAMSLPVQDALDTINRDAIDKSVAFYHNEHYILGFPSTGFAGLGLTGNNIVAAYNLLTQSWCGLWSWAPTCFARRTDLGQYSKLILGDAQGLVQQWMDDISLSEETDDSYSDRVLSDGTGGADVRTTILTRAITFGDLFSYKTGLNVEFEFDESEATQVSVRVILDKVVQTQLIAPPFSSASRSALRLPFRIPIPPAVIRLTGAPDLLRKAFDLQRYGTWRELQFQIDTLPDTFNRYGKLALRSVRVTGFMDTLQLQTLPPPLPPPLATTYILTGPDGGPTGVTSNTFIVQLDGPVDSAVTVTPVDTGPGASGIFTPTSIALTTGVPGVFTYLPVALTGAKTISTTNDAALVDPDPLIYTVT